LPHRGAPHRLRADLFRADAERRRHRARAPGRPGVGPRARRGRIATTRRDPAVARRIRPRRTRSAHVSQTLSGGVQPPAIIAVALGYFVVVALISVWAT